MPDAHGQSHCKPYWTALLCPAAGPIDAGDEQPEPTHQGGQAAEVTAGPSAMPQYLTANAGREEEDAPEMQDEVGFR